MPAPLFPSLFYRRRVLRRVLRSLRHEPQRWKCCAWDHATHEGLHCELHVPFCWDETPIITLHGIDLAIPLFWRGRLRRAVRRAAWLQATARMFCV